MAISGIFKIVRVIDGVAFHLKRRIKYLVLKGDLDNATVGLQNDIRVLQDVVFEIEQEWKRRQAMKKKTS